MKLVEKELNIYDDEHSIILTMISS